MSNEVLVHVRIVRADADKVVVVHEAFRFYVVGLALPVAIGCATDRLTHLEGPTGHPRILGVLILLLDDSSTSSGFANDVWSLELAPCVPVLVLGEE